MKLRNKKTGMIGEVGYFANSDGNVIVNNIDDQDEWYEYSSLAELIEDWEDCGTPKEYWYVDHCGDIEYDIDGDYQTDRDRKQIGNYFKTKKEAEKAVEKLEAWKRLEDSGFRVNNWVYALEGNRENGSIPIEIKAECKVKTPYKDLDLLFGGEE